MRNLLSFAAPLCFQRKLVPFSWSSLDPQPTARVFRTPPHPARVFKKASSRPLEYPTLFHSRFHGRYLVSWFGGSRRYAARDIRYRFSSSIPFFGCLRAFKAAAYGRTRHTHICRCAFCQLQTTMRIPSLRKPRLSINWYRETLGL
jgi:hypothetical protein